MPTLSVILITRNEEANLDACLASLEGIAQQIVVVDTNSADRTLEIAQKHGALIANPTDWPGFGPQKNRALALATGEWVLSLDADERLTPSLKSEILTAINHNAHIGIADDLFDILAGVPIMSIVFLGVVPPTSQMT
jgi:glycosyltransferase involved in cell wall biosynthesis